MHWFTLAVGEPFVRVDKDDEWMAGRWYQIEAMLSAALGASMDTMKNTRYLALKWWPFTNDDSPSPWTGVDGHCAIQDVWVDPPGTHPRKAYLCTHTGCLHSRPENPLANLRNLKNHLEAHARGTLTPYVLGAATTCSDPRCTYDRRTHTTYDEFSRHEQQHIDGHFECHACGLRFGSSKAISDHVNIFCIVEDAPSIHQAYIDNDPERADLVCSEPRCGQHFWYQFAEVYARHVQSHVDDAIECDGCGLKLAQYSRTLAHHKKNFCPRRFDDDYSPLVVKKFWTCPDIRCGAQYPDNSSQAGIEKHKVSHPIDGKFPCLDCLLPHTSTKGLAAHRQRGCYNSKQGGVDEEAQVDEGKKVVVEARRSARIKRKHEDQ